MNVECAAYYCGCGCVVGFRELTITRCAAAVQADFIMCGHVIRVPAANVISPYACGGANCDNRGTDISYCG
ncbi:hypothetical protein HYDPIDRAFT_110583 [Hydnomerulius pinastri MD-312]|nr:hypothetical protein HYDPIDRAFT_110583 [Hydnomerulius pinastri MD-312]